MERKNTDTQKEYRHRERIQTQGKGIVSNKEVLLGPGNPGYLSVAAVTQGITIHTFFETRHILEAEQL